MDKLKSLFIYLLAIIVTIFSFETVQAQLLKNSKVIRFSTAEKHESKGFFGDDCSSSADCRNDLWLNCTKSDASSKCSCLEGMIPGEKKSDPCLSKIEQKCQTEISTSQRNCVQNGYCYNGICQCVPGYTSAPSKNICLIGNDSSAVCKRLEDCNYYLGLNCYDGRCACDSKKELWDTKNGKCVRKIGYECNETGEKQKSCVENGVCGSSKICTCSGDFMKSVTGECKLSYGKRCTEDGNISSCHPNFVCIRSALRTTTSCSCRPTAEIYDQFNRHCDKLVGQECGDDGNLCVANSQCYNGKCVCSYNFEPNEDGVCVTGHGGDCSYNPNICNKKAKLTCNSERRRCVCERNYEYNEISKQCVGLPGAACNESSDPFGINECYILAECKWGRCQCKTGYTSNTPDGKCQLTFDQQCSIQDPCNPYDFLHCDVTTQRCTCETENMVHDPNVTSCIAKFGTLCFLSKIDGRQLNCGNNARCHRLNSTLPQDYGTCQCTKGFLPGETGICDLKGGANRIQLQNFAIIICIFNLVYLLF